MNLSALQMHLMQSIQMEKVIVEEWFKSSGEVELIVQNKVSDLVEWARELLEELGHSQMRVPMFVYSTCTIQMVKQGPGSFKKAKHMKVHYFWLKE
jgi:hypothetical protein